MSKGNPIPIGEAKKILNSLSSRIKAKIHVAGSIRSRDSSGGLVQL